MSEARSVLEIKNILIHKWNTIVLHWIAVFISMPTKQIMRHVESQNCCLTGRPTVYHKSWIVAKLICIKSPVHILSWLSSLSDIPQLGASFRKVYSPKLTTIASFHIIQILSFRIILHLFTWRPMSCALIQ